MLTTPKTQHALTVATKAHQGQMYSDEPYDNHLVRVANIMTERGGTEDDVCVALLHDTLEDTELTFEQIDDQFGLSIAMAVLMLTHNKNKETYMDYIQRLAPHAVARQVKLCDLADNMTHCQLNETLQKSSLLRRYEQAELYLETP